MTNQIEVESVTKSGPVARWETRGKAHWLELTRGETPNSYWYRGNGCGGGVDAVDDADAVRKMELPWRHPEGTGQVTVLKSDRPSLKRVL